MRLFSRVTFLGVVWFGARRRRFERPVRRVVRGSGRHAPATPPVEEAVDRGPRAGWVIRGLMRGVASCHVDAREVFWLGECALGTGFEASSRVCLAPIARTDADTNSPPDVHKPTLWHGLRMGGIRPMARRRPDNRTTKTTGIDVGAGGKGRQAVSQARSDSLYHFTSLAMPSEKGVCGS